MMALALRVTTRKEPSHFHHPLWPRLLNVKHARAQRSRGGLREDLARRQPDLDRPLSVDVLKRSM